MNILELVGRGAPLFQSDIVRFEDELTDKVSSARFLVIGGAGSIGQAVTREIFKRKPQALHVVDISENNLVELVRDIRSTLGYIDGDFQTYAIDCGSVQFDALLAHYGQYDYILNLSALKHVRSESDPFTLMRMLDVNVLNTLDTLRKTAERGARKYFCVSTDKAANPANLMGASKRIMEMFLMRAGLEAPVSMARFANVAFSDGSLLHGFNQRFAKRQPISAPDDVLRYFITPQESGELCLCSCLLGAPRDIFFPKLSADLDLTKFSEIAVRYLHTMGFEPYQCATEDEARSRAGDLIPQGKWPVYFFSSDTTGEKPFEEFFTAAETLDMDRFEGIGIIKNAPEEDRAALTCFLSEIANLKSTSAWSKDDLVTLIGRLLPELNHLETGKYLDGRM